jgi:PAS domain S-box-containing protein
LSLEVDIADAQLLRDLAPQVLERMHDALVIADEGGKMVFVNTKAELLFGYHRGEMLGRTVEMLLPDAIRGKHEGHRESFSNDPRPRLMGAGMQLHARKKNGTEIPVEISLSPMPTPRGIFVVTMVRLQTHAQ